MTLGGDQRLNFITSLESHTFLPLALLDLCFFDITFVNSITQTTGQSSDISSIKAQTALSSTNWNIEEAVSVFYAGQDAPAEPSQSPHEADSPQPIPVAPTSQPAPSAQPPSNTRRTQQPASRMRTIHDLSNDHDGSGSESDDEPEKNFFTGGEKSGLAVQRPNRGGDNAGPSGGPTPNYFDDLLNQARRCVTSCSDCA